MSYSYNPSGARLGGNEQDAKAAELTLLQRIWEELTVLQALSGGGGTPSNTLLAYAVWEMIPGNSKTIAYYAPGPGNPGNPSGSASNPETITFLENGSPVLVQTFTYDSSNNILTIVAS